MAGEVSVMKVDGKDSDRESMRQRRSWKQEGDLQLNENEGAKQGSNVQDGSGGEYMQRGRNQRGQQQITERARRRNEEEERFPMWFQATGANEGRLRANASGQNIVRVNLTEDSMRRGTGIEIRSESDNVWLSPTVSKKIYVVKRKNKPDL
jgi:hypothetical protein